MTEKERLRYGISEDELQRLTDMKDHDLLIELNVTVKTMQNQCPMHEARLGKLENSRDKQGVRLGWIEKVVYGAWGVIAAFATMLLRGDIKP